jgi:hypothetical protein
MKKVKLWRYIETHEEIVLDVPEGMTDDDDEFWEWAAIQAENDALTWELEGRIINGWEASALYEEDV